jgi:hypothetical protein
MPNDDRPDDAPTEWLSPALYRQLCDAVDAALFAPPDARDGILGARLGGDQRLLAEARALLASHEASPHTFISPMPAAGGGDDTIVGQPESATMIRRDSATVIVPGSGSRRAFQPETDGTAEIAAMPAQRPSSGTVTLRAPIEPPPAPGAEPAPDPIGTASTDPRIPVAGVGSAPSGGRPVWGAASPINLAPPPIGPAPPPLAPPEPPPVAGPPPSRPVAVASPAPPHAAAPPPAPAPTPIPARASDFGAPVPTRRTGGSSGTLVAGAVAALAVVGLAVLGWLWYQSNAARQDAELRLAQAEKRFGEVRQLGQRLAEVDRMLAVTPDAGAQSARAVLVRAWLQYLQDLQRASGGTDRELLFEVGKGYRQLAAAQGGLSGRTLNDRASAAKTLQIGERLLAYLDRTSTQPDRAILSELVATHVDLGDVLAAGQDASASTEQYRRALAAAERLGGAGVGAADVKTQTDMIRRRIQSGPPAPPAAVVDAAPIATSEQP